MDVTGISIAEAQRIEDASIVDARINTAGQLILKRGNEEEFNAGQVVPDLWPVGSVYISMTPTNPTTTLKMPNSTWARIAQGRTIIGQDPNDATMNDAGEIGGAKNVKLTAGNIPQLSIDQGPHSHEIKNANGDGAALVGGDAQVVPLGAGGTQGIFAVTQPVGAAYTTATDPAISTIGNADPAAVATMPPYFTTYIWHRTA